MSTKICKWTRESGRRSEFQDLTRRSHQKTTHTLTLSEVQRIQLLANKSEDTVVIPEIEDRILLTRPAKVNNESETEEYLNQPEGRSSHKKEVSPAGFGTTPPAEGKIGSQDNLSTSKKKKYLITRRGKELDHYNYTGSEAVNNKIHTHPMYAEFPPIKDAQKEMEEILLRKKYLDEIKKKLFPLEEVDVRKKLNPYDEVVKGQVTQMEEKAKRKKEEKKINEKWDKEMLKDILRAEKEEEEKLKMMIANKNKMKKDLDEMCEMKQRAREKLHLIERKESDNIRATTKFYEEQKRQEQMEKLQRKEALQRTQQRDILEHKKYLQRLKDQEEMNYERDIEFSVFKRAMGRKMRQHLKEKMEGKFNKKNIGAENDSPSSESVNFSN